MMMAAPIVGHMRINCIAAQNAVVAIAIAISAETANKGTL